MGGTPDKIAKCRLRSPALNPFGRLTARTPDPTGRERLIVVEDDPVTRAMIAGYFIDNNFEVVEAKDCAECRLALKTRADLIFIDLQLPDGDGFELAKEVQALSSAGIIFVTRRDTEVDRILGLEVAGDHYVTKPINLRDLLARARSLLRRRAIERDAANAATTTIVFGGWIIDLVRRELSSLDGTLIHLTRAEFDLLAALVGADGRPLSREYLIEVVSNRQTDVDVRTVDALIARLRRKLVGGSDHPVIATVTGIGYKLAPDERR